MHRITTAIFVAAAMSFTPSLAGDRSDSNWPSFRGPGATGVADGHTTPTTWSVEAATNVAWKTAIPGLGLSSPAIWGDRLFVTTAISETDPDLRVGLYGDIDPVMDDSVHKFVVYALDRDTGKIVWSKTAHEGVPKIKRHTKSSHANPTPATDGKHVVALFGSEGMYGFDMKGNQLWKVDLGTLDSGYFQVPEAQWGFASSPVIHDGRVIVQADVQENSFLAAFDVKTGKEIWRTSRDDVPTWSTPTVYDGESRTEILVNGFKHIGGYDFATGKELWRMTGGGDIPIPTPYVVDGHIFITNAHGPGSPILVIKTGATGDISLKDDARTNDWIPWSRRGGGSYMPTTVVYDGLLYVCRDSGVLSVFDVATGERYYQKRLAAGTGWTSSPVAADGKVYFTNEEGDTHVVKAGKEFEELAVNDLSEVVLASPAISGEHLFYRTRGHVVAVGKK